MTKKDYFHQVYEVVKLVPKGRVTTYGAIAAYLGIRSGARLVGWAMNASHTLPEVPAHRVVNSKGILTGKHHFSTPNEMQKRLEKEGVKIKNDQVVDFDKLLWEPSKELL
jgi:methylated-DNA-protein-cysteine methyltransferase-like protein